MPVIAIERPRKLTFAAGGKGGGREAGGGEGEAESWWRCDRFEWKRTVCKQIKIYSGEFALVRARTVRRERARE